MQGGNNQNQDSLGQGAYPESSGVVSQPVQADQPAYPQALQNGGSVDSISQNNQSVGEVNLGPNQVAPNLAKENDYFTDQSYAQSGVPQDPTSTPSPEMQYPSYNESHESSFNPKLIIIIVGVVIALGVSIGGIIYFFSSRNATKNVEEVDLFSEEESDPSAEEPKEDTAKTEPETPAPVSTPAPTIPTVPTQNSTLPAPKIETTQPEPPTPDDTGAVEGSG